MKRAVIPVVLAAVLGFAAALALTLSAQHSFPIRLDDEPPTNLTAAATALAGVAVTDALKLTPQDEPPFACTTATVGSLYVQTDKCNDITFSDTLLCLCSDHQNGLLWVFINGNNDCATLTASDC